MLVKVSLVLLSLILSILRRVKIALASYVLGGYEPLLGSCAPEIRATRGPLCHFHVVVLSHSHLINTMLSALCCDSCNLVEVSGASSSSLLLLL